MAESLFDKLYEGSEELKKKIKKPLIRRSVKMKMHKAYDDLSHQIDDLQMEIHRGKESLEFYDVNNIDIKMEKLEALKAAQARIKEQYLSLFGKTMKVTEFDTDDETA